MNRNEEWNIFSYPKLEEEEILLLLEDKEKNENEIIKGTARLVKYIYNRYYSSYIKYKDDILQDGLIGLTKAIRTYKKENNTKFISYAYAVIHNEMRRTLSNNVNLVRLPNDKSLLLNYLRKKIREFFSIYEHEPNIEELANFTNTKITEISDIYNYLFEPLSLERPLNIHDENSDNMKDNLIDETYMIEDEYINSETNERLLKVINNLPEKYQLFIKIRFGLYDGNEHTLEETARILYSLNITDSVLTRERIRQIQDYVINVLKDKKILKYIDNERYNEKIESHKENKTTKSLKKSLNL